MAATHLPLKASAVSETEKPTRTWQEIAEEAFHEQDSTKLLKLSEELECALDERAKRLHPQSVPDAKKQSA
jgi:hypothetical protein